MFHVTNMSGSLRPFAPGEIRARRSIEAVGSIQPTAGTTPSSEAHTASAPKQSHLLAHYSKGEQRQPEQALYAYNIMTSPVLTAAASTPVGTIAEILTARRFRHIPIVSTSGSLVGLISDRDLWRYQAAAHADLSKPVSTIMVTQVLVATADTLIRDLARTMFEERVGSLPIVSTDNIPEGIVTRSDILRALIAHGPLTLWV